MPKTLSEKLKEEIAARDDSVNGIALAAGIAQAQLWHFMQGTRDIRLETADKLAAYLGLELTSPKKVRRNGGTTQRKGKSQ